MRHEPFPSAQDAMAGRRGDRVALEVLAEVRLGAGPWRRARLQDVSVTGFRLSGIPHGVQGSEVRIRIPGLEALSAFVRWRDGSGMGCEFARPLSIYVLEHMARRNVV